METNYITPPPALNHAGFWKRFAAYFIDYAVIGFASSMISYTLYHSQELNQRLMDSELSGERNEVYIRAIIFFFFQWSYFAGMESSPLRATIGKLAVGIYVTDLNSERISFGKATGRYFGKMLSGLILGIGYLMAGFNVNKQGLHDVMAGTYVQSK